jgi:hypothetical protein
VRLCAVAALCAGAMSACAVAPQLRDDVDEAVVPGAVYCPDGAACAAACGGQPATCGWTWGQPACVCAPAVCDADACYAHEDALRVCGTSPDGDPVEACVAR